MAAWLEVLGWRWLLAVIASFFFVLPSVAGDRTPQPVIEKARAGTECIADPATMRRDHPSMLKHQRDDTVRGGVRGAKASLKACVECHASATTHSVAQAPTDFCSSCHRYAAVSIDCFECHATKPAGSAAQALRGLPNLTATLPAMVPATEAAR